jgi:tRNA-splicing ligase RtcB
MDINRFICRSEYCWEIPKKGAMRVPGRLFASEELIQAMDDKVWEQTVNVACLPGIVEAAFAMPDAHWGYGFPIGGVAAFDPKEGGIVSAGGVGFDISCGVRTLHTGLKLEDLDGVREELADLLYQEVPAGLGSQGLIRMTNQDMRKMLNGGAKWAIEQGFGELEDLKRIEEYGSMADAHQEFVSDHAKKRQKPEMGTLGSGNHYLEVQAVTQIYDQEAAALLGIALGDIKVSIHCGSRGLGHQIGTEYLKRMAVSAQDFHIKLPDRELACAPIDSHVGQEYLGAMRAAINCAFANRQIITHLTRWVFEHLFPGIHMPLLYDISHNTCKKETHLINGQKQALFVHRKGATRAFGPGHACLPESLKPVGQPVLIGGSMGTASYILVGLGEDSSHAFGSSCHGAGRALSRRKAHKTWKGQHVMQELKQRGIIIRSPSMRGIAEEAPAAYKDVSSVVAVAEKAGLSKRVARLEPVVCLKG